jgi:hypothetical protein
MKLLDNRKTGKVGDVVRDSLGKGAKLSVLSGLFSIYAFEALKKELNQVDSVRLLLTKLLSAEESNQNPTAVFLTGNQFERRFRNQLSNQRIARECAEWLKNKSEVKTVLLAAGCKPELIAYRKYRLHHRHPGQFKLYGIRNGILRVGPF